MIDIDLMITSCGRADCLNKTIISLQNKLKYSKNINMQWMIHDDFYDRDESTETHNLIDNKYDDLFNVILFSNENIGQAKALTKLIEYSSAKYIIYFEDDWEIVRDIDVDILAKILEQNKDINQIVFNKRPTMTHVSEKNWAKKEIERSGYQLVVQPHWSMLPGIWRAKFIKSHWIDYDYGDFGWELTCKIQNERAKYKFDADWVMKHLGTYYFGRFGEPPYVKHIGGDPDKQRRNIIR